MLEKSWKSDLKNYFINFLRDAWQVLLLINLKVCIMRDRLIEWNGTVFSNNNLFVGSSSLIPLRNSIIQYFLTLFETYVPGDTRDSRGKHCRIKFLCIVHFLWHLITLCHSHVPWLLYAQIFCDPFLLDYSPLGLSLSHFGNVPKYLDTFSVP